MPLHKDLTGADLHEPKGAASAAANTVYISNGSGSGTWTKVGPSVLNTSVIAYNRIALTGVLADISSASSVLVTMPLDATIAGITFTLGGVITGANSLISVSNKAGSFLGPDLTINYLGSAEGNQFSFPVSYNNNLAWPNFLKIQTDGGSTGAVPLYFTIDAQVAL